MEWKDLDLSWVEKRIVTGKKGNIFLCQRRAKQSDDKLFIWLTRSLTEEESLILCPTNITTWSWSINSHISILILIPGLLLIWYPPRPNAVVIKHSFNTHGIPICSLRTVKKPWSLTHPSLPMQHEPIEVSSVFSFIWHNIYIYILWNCFVWQKTAKNRRAKEKPTNICIGGWGSCPFNEAPLGQRSGTCIPN